MSAKPRIILDCDPGLDDAVAIVLAAEHTELIGITTVGGNAPLIDVTNNALLTCQVFDLDVPVHSGAVKPLVAMPMHAPEVHGEKGFDGPELPELDRSVASDDAVRYLIDSARSIEDLWIVATGPLTNLALAFREAPDIVTKINGVSWMGGSAAQGNHTAAAEFNALVDPEAVDEVFRSGLKWLFMAGLDLTHQFTTDDHLHAQVEAIGSTGSQMIADLMANYLNMMDKIVGTRVGALHDPCAVMALTHPDLIQRTMRHVVVELDGTHTRGMTLVDQRRNRDGVTPNVEWGHTIDAAAAKAVMVSAIASQSMRQA